MHAFLAAHNHSDLRDASNSFVEVLYRRNYRKALAKALKDDQSAQDQAPSDA